jgi:GT2 family glycosyltransferase
VAKGWVHEDLPGVQGAMIGVVVPAYNREDNLALLLASLERQSAARRAVRRVLVPEPPG